MHTPTFAGRSGPLAEFTRALRSHASAAESGAILYVHGPAGIGKTALLGRFAAIARAGDHHVVEIDAARSASAPALQGQVREAAAIPGTVLLLDHIDRVKGADGTMPSALLAEAGDNTLTVIAGHDAPSGSWLAAASRRGGLRALLLGPLSDADARALVSGLGTDADEDVSELVIDFAKGHPLALVLAEAARAEGRFRHGEAPQELVLALLDQLVGAVPSSAHRQALEIAAHSRWTTEDLLRAAVSEDGGSPADLFDWLRRRPFVHAERNGVSLLPLARDLLDKDLRWRDPSRYRSMHERIRTHLLEQIRKALPHQILPATAALTYLHRHNGFVARFLTWQYGDRFQELPYRRELRDDVLRFVTSLEGTVIAARTARWLDAQPRGFHIYWDTAAHAPAAVLAWLRLDAAGEDAATDLLEAAAQHHARSTQPLRPQEHLTLARVYIPRAAHHAASELMDLVIYRILAGFLRDTPAWSFIGLASGSFLDPLMRYIDQRPVRPPVIVQGLSFTLYAHDWRAVTIERWMEVGHLAELAGPAARPAARPRSGPGAFTVLTREEFDRAVGDALAAWQRKDLLASNPLLRTRLAAGHGSDDPVAALRKIMTEAVDALKSDPRAEKYHRALVTGYLRGAPTREAAAERLGLPLSTFRRHLSRGLERVRASLWELESAPRATGTDPSGEATPGTSI
ncbi:AAA family ATPase [Streptomyces sp. NPDC001675]